MTNEDLDLEEIPVDADESLITAYLARRMSIVERQAVEERLADDPAFCAKVRPIMDAWYLPMSFMTAEDEAFLATVPREPVLSPAKVQAGVDRFFAERRARLALAEPAPIQPEPAPYPTPAYGGKQFNPWTLQRTAALIISILGSGATLIATTTYTNQLDRAPHETASEIRAGNFYRDNVEPLPLGTRRIEIGAGIVVTLAADSRLTFRPVAREAAFVVNVEGEATIEVPADEMVYLATPAAHAALHPGRYSFRSLDSKSPMMARVDSGSMTVVSRNTNQELLVEAGQFVRASVGHVATLSAPQRDLPHAPTQRP